MNVKIHSGKGRAILKLLVNRIVSGLSATFFGYSNTNPFVKTFTIHLCYDSGG